VHHLPDQLLLPTMQRICRVAMPVLCHAASGPRIHRFAPLQLHQLHFRGHRPPFKRFYFSQPSASKQCPACGAPLDITEISCKTCSTLSPLPEDINYLPLFGFSAKQPFDFDLDLGKLKREYLKMMSKVHPDSVIDKSEAPSYIH
jgi:hypothetical protein